MAFGTTTSRWRRSSADVLLRCGDPSFKKQKGLTARTGQEPPRYLPGRTDVTSRIPRRGAMQQIPSSATARETAEQKRQLDNKETVYFIITETRALGLELGLQPFPHVAPNASPETVAKTY